MRWMVRLTLLAGAVALAVTIGQRMSTEAMAVAVGVVFGVAASIPTSLLVLAAARSRRDEHRSWQDPPPPQIYVVTPGSAGHTLGWPTGAQEQPAATSWPLPSATAGRGHPPRRFKVVGEDEYWLQEPL